MINISHVSSTREHPWSLFYHFVGAGSSSHDFLTFLKRLLHHFNRLEDTRMLASLESHVQLVRNALCETNIKPTLIFIDGVDQVRDVTRQQQYNT